MITAACDDISVTLIARGFQGFSLQMHDSVVILHFSRDLYKTLVKDVCAVLFVKVGCDNHVSVSGFIL
jgi:hypothetical protein